MSDEEQVRLLTEIRDVLLRHEESYRAITTKVLRRQRTAIVALLIFMGLGAAIMLMLLLPSGTPPAN